MEELKPCPFCGGKALIKEIKLTKQIAHEVNKPNWNLFHSYKTRRYKNGRIGEVFIYDVELYEPVCENKFCPCYHGQKYDSLIEALKAWNKRTEGGDAP